MDHIGDGSAWDLAGRTRGISILPPKTGEKDWDWYKGTADAVRQNLSFISSGPYTDVLILSGDHIYCMDYGPLIHFHREHRAHVTIGMLPVAWEETRHFGTGTLDGQIGSSTGRKSPDRPARISPPWASTCSIGSTLSGP